MFAIIAIIPSENIGNSGKWGRLPQPKRMSQLERGRKWDQMHGVEGWQSIPDMYRDNWVNVGLELYV